METDKIYAQQIDAAEYDLGYTLTPGQRVDLLLDNNSHLRSSAEARQIVDRIGQPRADSENVIILSRGKDAWYAEYIGPHAEDMRKLFGFSWAEKAIIPTAFTPQADAQTVLKTVSGLNPDVRVVLA